MSGQMFLGGRNIKCKGPGVGPDVQGTAGAGVAEAGSGHEMNRRAESERPWMTQTLG